MNKYVVDFKLRFSDILFIAVFIVALASGQQVLSIDSDLGRHLTFGNYMLNERVRQIEAQALSRLRHPGIRKLHEYLGK